MLGIRYIDMDGRDTDTDRLHTHRYLLYGVLALA